MSTETTGDGRPATVDPAGRAAAADRARDGEADGPAGDLAVGDPADGPGGGAGAVPPERGPREDRGPGDDEAGPLLPGEAPSDLDDDGTGSADEDDAASRGGYGESAGDDEYDEYDEHDYDAADGYDGALAPDAAAAGELIEFAEPVDLDGVPGPHQGRPWRARLFIALGFVLAAGAIITAAVFVVGSVTHGFKKPVKITYKTSALFSLRTGNCFDPVGASHYTLVSCNSPHTAEVFATFALAGGKWPGSTVVAADASSGCSRRLTGYLNPELAISLTSAYVYPDATAWQAGTRTVVCEVRAASGELTGSVQGASATAG